MKILPTEYFEKEVKRLSKKYPSLNADLRSLFNDLQENPQMGEPLGQDCFKIRLRIASKNRGKSGGGRIITCVKIVKERIFVLKIYDKAEHDTIDNSELEKLVEYAKLLNE
jgi:mRNA-degrading endonuclease RelE of RelBE toxin-antitoxin system